MGIQYKVSRFAIHCIGISISFHMKMQPEMCVYTVWSCFIFIVTATILWDRLEERKMIGSRSSFYAHDLGET